MIKTNLFKRLSFFQSDMLSISEMIQSGYKSLANRALNELSSFETTLPRQMPQVQKEFETYKRKLEQLSRSGDIYSLGNDTLSNFRIIIDIFDQSIPSRLKPQSPTAAVGMAISAVRAYEKISTIEELLSKTGILRVGRQIWLARNLRKLRLSQS